MLNISLLKNNIIGSYLVQFCIMFTPIILLPILSRGMQNEDFGTLLYLQSISLLGTIIIEFGFNITGPRLISEDVVNKIHILYSKLLLAIVNVGFTFLLLYFSGANISLEVKILCVIYSCFSGLNFYWYFLSVEKLIINSIIELLSSLITIIVILLAKQYYYLSTTFVLYVYSFAKVLSFVSGCAKFFIDKNIESVSFSKIFDILKYSVSAFIFRCGGSLYTIINGYLIGTFLGVSAAGLYLQSERLVKATFMGLIVPFNSGFYPRLLKGNINKYPYITFVFVVSCILSVAQMYFSEYLLMIFYGNANVELVTLFRLFSLLLPIISMINTFCYLFVFPNKNEYILSKMLVIVGFINVALLKFVLDNAGVSGGVLFNIILESSVLIFVFFLSWRSKHE